MESNDKKPKASDYKSKYKFSQTEELLQSQPKQLNLSEFFADPTLQSSNSSTARHPQNPLHNNPSNQLSAQSKYKQINNMSRKQVVKAKLDAYYRLYSLLYHNMYSDEFEQFRKTFYLSVGLLTASNSILFFFFPIHPLKHSLAKISLVITLWCVFHAAWSNLDRIAKGDYDDSYRKGLVYKVKDIKNEIALYNPLNKAYDNGTKTLH